MTTSGTRTVVTVRQDGQMPSPVVLAIEFEDAGSLADAPGPGSMSNAELREDGAWIVTWPVDVWFDGRGTFEAELDCGERRIKKITLDPDGRFPDRDVLDNVWPRGE